MLDGGGCSGDGGAAGRTIFRLTTSPSRATRFESCVAESNVTDANISVPVTVLGDELDGGGCGLVGR